MDDQMGEAIDGGDHGRPSKRRGNFFAVDLETYRAVCAMGDPDVAASYLILAAGTGADNRTSTWSREAINERTSLNWRKARDCVDKLVGAGLASWIKRGARPRLDLAPVETKLPPISVMASQMVDLVKEGQQPAGQAQKAAAARARQLGYIVQRPDGSYAMPAARKLQMVWMPKELVDGAAGERPPVERVRRARDAQAFRLLVELYSAQDLAEQAGVDRRWLIRKFDREAAHATGQYQTWSFKRKSMYVGWGGVFADHRREPTAAEKEEGKNAGHDFFQRLDILHDAGLVEWVYYLTEDEAEDAMLIHPVAVERQGEVDWTAFESIIGSYAIRASLALRDDPSAGNETMAGYYEALPPRSFLLPAERLLRKVQVQGVPRLRYRAKTTNTIRWLDDLMTGGREYIEGYRQLVSEHSPELLAVADQRLADFNVTSTLDQRRVQRDINDSSQSASSGSVPNGTAVSDGDQGEWIQYDQASGFD